MHIRIERLFSNYFDIYLTETQLEVALHFDIQRDPLVKNCFFLYLRIPLKRIHVVLLHMNHLKFDKETASL